MFDIDIDFADRERALVGLHHVDAMLTNREEKINRHPSGVYFQDIPLNPITGLASFDYKQAEDAGYFKVDFLNQSIYQQVRDEEHLITLMETDPPWELLDELTLVEQLAHIRDHFSVVQAIKPRCINDLAVILALIRPGKRHLLGRPRAIIDKEVWKLDGEAEYQFKRGHALSYALLIVVQMNLIMEQLADRDDGISI